MTPKRWPLFAALLACLSCGDDTSTAPDDFLPIFTNSWRSTEDPDHTFNLISADDFQRSGVITGTENFNFEESNLEGSFEGLQVTRLTYSTARRATRCSRAGCYFRRFLADQWPG